MTNKPSGHRQAFEKWFERYEIARKKKHLPIGRNVAGVPPAPPSPDEVRRVIFNSFHPIGERLAAELCNVHRTTIGRWLDGSVQIPASAYALLRFHAEGVPPSCGDAWVGFAFHDNSVTLPDGRTTLTAMEISGFGYKNAYILMLERRVADLENQLIELAKKVDWGSANDAYISPQDIRSKAFNSE